MVQMMKNGKSVKIEVEDHLEEEHGPVNKRQKQNLRMGSVAASASQYNPLDEPSPLGLRLRKSPSLLELIQMKLSQSSTAKAGGQSQGKKQSTGGGSSGDKLKASNFPASILRIGTWEYKSRYEGDLVAKCYFAKHKLVWEVLDGGLKNKIEIQWSDIMALKAAYPDDGPGTLDVVLARQPLFFRETNPQPRKHTLWQATSDFTGGQASIQKRHYLECPQGLLGKHFEKLIQCDPRLNFLSQQGDIVLDSPYFEPRIPVFDDQNEEKKEYDLNREGSPSIFSLHETTSPSGVQSSSSKTDQDVLSRYSADTYPHETPSPCSGMSTLTVEDIKNGGLEQLKTISNWDQIKVPGIRPSMSMTDLVSHLETRISEQGPSEQPNLSSEEWESFQILEDINRCLFSDFQNMPDSDEKSLMSRVNSLCCLLQKDPVTKAENPFPSVQNGASTDENGTVGAMNNENGVGKMEGKQSIPPNEIAANGISLNNESGSMSRNDSVGDLLLNLPRIASLPQFLFNISEDFESKAR